LLDNSSQFLSSEQPSEPKNLDVALNIARVEKIHSENLRLWSVWRPLSRSKLYFARCYALKRTGTFASEIKVMCFFYLILRSDVLMFRIAYLARARF